GPGRGGAAFRGLPSLQPARQLIRSVRRRNRSRGCMMEFRLKCECGQQLPVTEDAAGGILRCPCGRSVQVPSLGDMRREPAVEDVGEPADRETSTVAEPRLPLPRSIKVLAGLYLLVGGLAVIETIWAASQGTPYLSIGVIGIPLGVGLLRRRRAW